MDAKVAPLAEIYRLNVYLLKKAVEGISEADLRAPVAEKGNAMQWIVGHIASSRYHLLNLLGVQMENPFGKLFTRGAAVQPAAAYPAVSEVLAAWQDVTTALQTRLDELADSDLSGASPIDFPVEDKTLLGGVTFLALHESYHIGQLGYIRKLLGYDTLVG